MVKSNSEIIEYIHSNHITKCQEGICGIQRSARIPKGHDLCSGGVNDGLKGSQGIGNVKSRHKTPNLLDKLHKNYILPKLSFG